MQDAVIQRVPTATACARDYGRGTEGRNLALPLDSMPVHIEDNKESSNAHG